MPWAGQPSIWRQNTLHERGAVVGATLCAHQLKIQSSIPIETSYRAQSVDLILDLCQQDLCVFDAFHFDLLLLSVFQVYRRKTFKFELLSHVSAGC